MFAFACARLDRQFEFDQREWVNDGKFIGALEEHDPLLGVVGRSPCLTARSAAA